VVKSCTLRDYYELHDFFNHGNHINHKEITVQKENKDHLMNSKQNILLSFAILSLFFMLLLIVFGDKGLADLNLMRQGKDGLIEKNTLIMQENIYLYNSIKRLKNDLDFIENIARHELGVVARSELIFKIEDTGRWKPGTGKLESASGNKDSEIGK